jgi:hypothetical protein
VDFLCHSAVGEIPHYLLADFNGPCPLLFRDRQRKFHAEIVKLVGKKGIELVVHPDVFKSPRYLKYGEQLKVYFPKITKDAIEQLGVRVVEATQPLPIRGC